MKSDDLDKLRKLLPFKYTEELALRAGVSVSTVKKVFQQKRDNEGVLLEALKMAEERTDVRVDINQRLSVLKKKIFNKEC